MDTPQGTGRPPTGVSGQSVDHLRLRNRGTEVLIILAFKRVGVLAKNLEPKILRKEEPSYHVRAFACFEKNKAAG